MKRGRRRNFDV